MSDNATGGSPAVKLPWVATADSDSEDSDAGFGASPMCLKPETTDCGELSSALWDEVGESACSSGWNVLLRQGSAASSPRMVSREVSGDEGHEAPWEVSGEPGETALRSSAPMTARAVPLPSQGAHDHSTGAHANEGAHEGAHGDPEAHVRLDGCGDRREKESRCEADILNTELAGRCSLRVDTP